jgi:hypothetical protein
VASYIRARQESQPGYPLKILDYSAQALVYNLLSNPVHAIAQQTINCRSAECTAYLLNSGLYLSTPWPPIDHAESPVIKIRKVLSRHLEYDKKPQTADGFEASDCKLYSDNGTTLIAIKLCLTLDASSNNEVNAGTLHYELCIT